MSVQCHLGSLSFTSWQAHNANANEQNAQASHAIIPCIVLLYQMDEFERSLYIKSLKADASLSYLMIGVHSIKKPRHLYANEVFVIIFGRFCYVYSYAIVFLREIEWYAQCKRPFQRSV